MSEKVLSEIEKAKNDALIQLSKSHDEKLKFHFDIIRYTTWLVITVASIILAAFAYVGIRGYRDITGFVETQSKRKAEAVINSREFQSKIDDELGRVVQSRMSKISAIDASIATLQKFLTDNNEKHIVHALFDTIDPRLRKIESMEQGAKTDFTRNEITLLNAKNDKLSVLFGKGELNLKGSKRVSVEIGNSRQWFYDKKFLFGKKFSEPPIVLVQSNLVPEGSFQTKFAVSAVKVENDGFLIDILGSGKREGVISLYPPGEVQFSYVAIGK
jgi:hypothetical protein